MSIDTANRIINEQEEAIAALNHKVLGYWRTSGIALGRVLECKKALRRIECAEDLATAHRIAKEAMAALKV